MAFDPSTARLLDEPTGTGLAGFDPNSARVAPAAAAPASTPGILQRARRAVAGKAATVGNTLSRAADIVTAPSEPATPPAALTPAPSTPSFDTASAKAAPEPKAPGTGGMGSEFLTGLKTGAGAQNVSMLGGALEAGGALVDGAAPSAGSILKRAGVKLQDWGSEHTTPPQVGSIADVAGGSIGDTLSRFGKYAAYQTGAGIGTSAPSIVIGGAAALATGGNPLAAFLAGAVGPSYLQNLGDVFTSAKEDPAISAALQAGTLTEDRVATTAALAAVPIAALDAVGLERVLGAAFKPAKAALRARILQGIATGAISEGSTEGLQNVISQWAQTTLGQNKPMGDRVIEVVDNVLGGAFAGGALGGVSGIAKPAPTPSGATPVAPPRTPLPARDITPAPAGTKRLADMGRVVEATARGELLPVEGAPPTEGPRLLTAENGPTTNVDVEEQPVENITAAPRPRESIATRAGFDLQETLQRVRREAPPASNIDVEEGGDLTGVRGVEHLDLAPPPDGIKVEELEAMPAGGESPDVDLADFQPDPLNTAAHEAATSPHNDLPEPSDVMKRAGNYRKGHVTFQGNDVTIEDPVGSTRSGTDPNGKPWSVEMSAHYGYLKRSTGADGDQVDVYLPEQADDNAPVHVFDQFNPDTGAFDEHKAVLGVATREEAERIYDAHFSDQSGPARRRAVTVMSPDEFKQWVRDGDTTKPAREASEPVSAGNGAGNAADNPSALPTLPAPASADDAADPDTQEHLSSIASSGAASSGTNEATETPLDDIEQVRADRALARHSRAARRYAKESKIDAASDELLAAIAKAGGISREQAERAGIDPAEFGRRGWKIKRVFTTGGATLEAMSERLAQLGYPVVDSDGRYGENAMLEALDRALRGEGMYAAEGSAARQAAVAAERADGFPPPADEGPDWLHSDAEPYLADAEYVDIETESQQRLLDATAMARDAGMADDEIEALIERSAIRGLSNDDIIQDLRARAAQATSSDQRRRDESPLRLEEESGSGTRTRAEISGYTAEDLAERERHKASAAEARAKADQKFEADSQVDSFVLTGSDREPDQAAARGQGDLLASGGDAPAPEPATPDKSAANKPASSAKAPAQPVARSTPKIDDFGEKLEGARKDYAATLKDAMDVDVAAAPLSKSWPEPDYQKLLDAGTSPWIVGWIRAMRDEVPTKPVKAYKVKSWVNSVTMLRQFAAQLLDGEITEGTVRTALEEQVSLRDSIGGRAELYQAVGHDTSLKGIGLKRGEYGVFNGVSYSPAKVIWSVEKKAKVTAYSNWPTMLASGDTREAAIADFKSKAGALAEKPSVDVKFDIYSYRSAPTKFVIGKKVGKGHLDLKTFDSVKEARQYLAEHKDELVAMLEKAKATPNERRDSNEPRVGADHRVGADVTPEMFSDAFGFRGVQFGNYVENAKRQADLNDAYDALMDLAGVVGVPPRALSLNGELGLAFGARGRGGKDAAGAHYERDKVVINLTKERGAGALAHEWWHSLDNYFGRMGGQAEGYPTEGTAGIKGVREQLLEAFRAVRAAVNSAALKARASALDARRSKAYWSTGREMSARAFEAYVIAKLQDQGQSNDYLANIVSEAYWNASEALLHAVDGKATYPYPTADEIPAIRAAFDEFFRTVETKETDRGVAMFARRTLPADENDDPGTAGIKILAANDELFRYPIADSKRLKDIVKAVDKEWSVTKMGWTQDEGIKDDYTASWQIGTDDSHAWLFEGKDGSVWINVEGFKEGSSEGAALYHIAANYAFNNGKVFRGDPAGMSPRAVQRRVEHMLSSALKFGTTHHLAPGREMNMPWKPGDDAANFRELVTRARDNLLKHFKPAANFIYNFDTRRFEDSDDGQPVADRDLEMLADTDPRVRAAGAGISTLKRAAILNAFLSEEGDAWRRQLLEKYAQLASPGGLDPALRGTFYARNDKARPSAGLSVSEVRAHLEAKVGKGAIRRLLDSGQFKILASNSSDLPADARQAMQNGSTVFGFTAADGTTYLIADHLNTLGRATTRKADGYASEDAYAIFLHEVGVHFGMRAILGDRLFAELIASANAAKGALGDAWAAGRAMVPKTTNPAHIDEEALAWLVTDHANHALPFVKRIVAAIRAFLVRLGFVGAATPDALVMLARGAIRRAANEVITDRKAMFAARDVSKTQAFRDWFKDSKVVDAAGEPMVVFHGTHADFSEFDPRRNLGEQGSFFSPEPGLAAFFSMGPAGPRTAGSQIMPVYLQLRNPKVVDFMGRNFPYDTGVGDLIEEARRAGHDGLILKDVVEGEAVDMESGGALLGKGIDQYVILRPEQVKSAIGNQGTFDPANPDIRFAASDLGQTVEDSPVLEQRLADRMREKFEPWLDAFRYEAQDRFHYLNKAQAAAAAERGLPELPESEDAYLAELRYHGMAGAAIEDFQREHVDPLLKAVSDAGLSIDQVDGFLHARHAPEANRQLRKINPTEDELADRIAEAQEAGDTALAARLFNHTPFTGDNTALSGMSDDAAAAVIERAREAGKLDALEAVGARVDAITAGRRRLLVDADLEAPGTIRAWESTYQHYVPLKREGKGNALPRRGRGFDTRGKEKRRAGSNRAVQHLLANVVAQHEATLLRAEKAKVGRALLNFARHNPDPALFEVDKVEFKPSFDAQGLVSYRAEPGFVLADNVLMVRERGHDHRITFNEANPDAMRIAAAVRNLGAEESGPIVNVLSKVSRILSLVNTGLNPEFIITNFARDLQTAGYNLSGTEADRMKWRIIRDAGRAWKGIRAFQKGQRGEWAEHFDAFRKAGGQTGWLDHYRDINDREKALVDKVQNMAGDKAHQVKRGLSAFLKFVEDENTAVENALRLAAFVHSRRSVSAGGAGLTDAKAARLAKELTVNFNRRGAMGKTLNALYLFYNASIQGQVRIVQAIARSRKVQALVVATVAGAVLLDIWNRALGDDDDEQMPNPYDSEAMRFVKDRNIVLMLPGGDYVKIPLPWGYNVFHVLGQAIGENLTSPVATPGASSARVAAAVVDAFNPIGGNASLLQMISPTIVDPIAQWYVNKDFIGRPLRPAENVFGPSKPESQRYWASVRPYSKAITDVLNSLTGGDEVRSGVLDFSPAAIDLAIDTAAGGAGRFWADVVGSPWKALKGEDLETYEVPLLRKVYGRPGASQTTQDYYKRRDAVALTVAQFRHYQSDPNKLREIRAEHQTELQLIPAMKVAEAQLRQLRQAKKRATDRAAQREVEARMKAVMDRFNAAYYRVVTRAAG